MSLPASVSPPASVIQRDYILRQIHQLAQALALVLFQRRSGRDEEAGETLDAALLDALGLDAAGLLGLERPALLAACGGEGALGAARMLAVADLLREEAAMLDARSLYAGAAAGYARARWLYLAASEEPDAALPFDYPTRIAWLEDLEARAASTAAQA